MGSLKSFIKAVRSSKTIAAERATIRKESASIRTAFRDVHLDETTRKVNISKLLYLYILGEPTYFGQIECLKLLASNKFTSKRLGYLAAMLILDENQEVLTLLTNSLDNDMKSSNHYIIALALVTLGNVASPELARDLYANVESLLGHSSSSYLKKKAAIVAAKLIEKDSDLSEIYVNYLPDLLRDNNHGVVLGGLQLTRSIYQKNEMSRDLIKNQLPLILGQLKLLLTNGYLPEYDHSNVPDPFLFVSILQTLRIILRDDHSNSNNSQLETINDLLTQIPSKISSNKSVGRSVLYETINTIFSINTDSSLKVLGIDLLSQFLTLKDNNTRYVALNMLLNVINYEPLAVQRHRNIIIKCLSDKDISIRRRALELTFSIMNKQNIRFLTKELLIVLNNTQEDELKSYITNQLTISINKFSPNIKWEFETLIEMLKIVGNYFNLDILSNILALIMNNQDQELLKFVLLQLVKSNEYIINQFGLDLITIWSIGEYGDLLLGSSYEFNEKVVTINEDKLVKILTNYFNLISFEDYSSFSTTNHSETNKVQIINYLLTSCLKLSIKLSNRSNLEKLRTLIQSQSNSLNLEIQLRSIEYLQIFNQPQQVKKGLLEKMPSPPIKLMEGMSLSSGGNSSSSDQAKKAQQQQQQQHHHYSSNTEDLLDLLGDSTPSSQPSSHQQHQPAQQQQQQQQQQANTMDLLSDIFGSSSLSTPAAGTAIKAAVPQQMAQTPVPALATTTAAASDLSILSTTNDVLAYKNTEVSVYFNVKEISDNTATVNCKIVNLGSVQINNLSISFAVTKGLKLQLFNISKKNLVSINDFANLSLKISGVEGSKMKMRGKLSYLINNTSEKNDQFNFAFKETL